MKLNRELIQMQVGAFVAVGLILVMMVLFLLGGEKRLFDRHYQVVCFFENISGLRAGAPVQLAGVHVGSVGQISFEEDVEKRNVRVVLHISHDYKNRIREDSVASIITQGLLGDKMILVSVGSSGFKVIDESFELATKPAYDLSHIIEKGEDLIIKVDDAVMQINDIFKEIKEGRGLIHALIYDPEGSQMIDNLESVSQNLKGASYHFQQITGKIDRGQGTMGALVNDATLFNDMKTLLGKANRNKLIRAVIRHTLKTKDKSF